MPRLAAALLLPLAALAAAAPLVAASPHASDAERLRASEATARWRARGEPKRYAPHRPASPAGRSFSPYAAAGAAAPVPGDAAPPFEVKLLSGLSMKRQGGGADPPLAVIVLDTAGSAFDAAMWNSNSSVDALVRGLANDTELLLVDRRSSSDNYEVRRASARLGERFDALNYTKAQVGQWRSRLGLAAPAAGSFGGSASWLDALVAAPEWQSEDAKLGIDTLTGGGELPESVVRLDARYDWLPGASGEPTCLAFYGLACQPQPAQDVRGCVALIDGSGGAAGPGQACDWFAAINASAAAGAAGAVVYADEVVDMSCEGDECDSLALQTPATMIFAYEGVRLRAHLLEWGAGSVNVSARAPAARAPRLIGIDAAGRVQEGGYFLTPTLASAAWQSQWFDFSARTAANRTRALAAGAVEVPVLRRANMSGHAGAVATVRMPANLTQFNTLTIDAAIGCEGPFDASCPAWDRTVFLNVSCEGAPEAVRGLELGRWITSFRRGVGRWETDASALLPLLAPGACTFQMRSDWWAKPWYPSLTLRLGRDVARPRAVALQPLFQGGAFNASYNAGREPVPVRRPAFTSFGTVHAIVTGHGSDNLNCAEFCATTHLFTVGTAKHSITFSNAGTAMGCADLVSTGVTPNEHGTWYYGRDGWCDGRNVAPWWFDATPDLSRGSEYTNVTYRGLYNGQDPSGTGDAQIFLSSYFVWWR